MKIEDTALILKDGEVMIVSINKRGQIRAGGKKVTQEFSDIFIDKFSGLKSLIYSKSDKAYMFRIKEISEEDAELFRRECNSKRKKRSGAVSLLLASVGVMYSEELNKLKDEINGD